MSKRRGSNTCSCMYITCSSQWIVHACNTILGVTSSGKWSITRIEDSTSNKLYNTISASTLASIPSSTWVRPLLTHSIKCRIASILLNKLRCICISYNLGNGRRYNISFLTSSNLGVNINDMVWNLLIVTSTRLPGFFRVEDVIILIFIAWKTWHIIQINVTIFVNTGKLRVNIRYRR